jgi:hypothetical protein
VQETEAHNNTQNEAMEAPPLSGERVCKSKSAWRSGQLHRTELLAVNRFKGLRRGGRRMQPENSRRLLQSMSSSEARRSRWRSLEN